MQILFSGTRERQILRFEGSADRPVCDVLAMAEAIELLEEVDGPEVVEFVRFQHVLAATLNVRLQSGQYCLEAAPPCVRTDE